MANTGTLLRTTNLSSKKWIHITDNGNELGVNCTTGAFEGVLHVAKIQEYDTNKMPSSFGPIYSVKVSLDGATGTNLDIFDDTTGLDAVDSSEAVVLVGYWFLNSSANDLTFYDGATAIVTLDLTANQGVTEPVENA